jgi:hypothetical protein
MHVRAIRSSEGARQEEQERSWRDEKVFIYFSPRGTAEFKGHPTAGDWVVAEPRKPVSPGQTVTWLALGNCTKFELNLPDVFEEPLQVVVQGNTASATLKEDAEPGLVLYEAYCNDQLAIGGSAPGVIIDR